MQGMRQENRGFASNLRSYGYISWHLSYPVFTTDSGYRGGCLWLAIAAAFVSGLATFLVAGSLAYLARNRRTFSWAAA